MLLVIGYGNPLRGDDGLGWRVAERLEAQAESGDWKRPAGLEVITCHQLTPELAVPLSRAARAVFVDAADPAEAGLRPGTLTSSELEPRLPEPGAFSHHLDPAGVLGLAWAWYGHAPQAQLITVAGERFDYAETLSPAVESTALEVLKMIKTM